MFAVMYVVMFCSIGLSLSLSLSPLSLSSLSFSLFLYNCVAYKYSNIKLLRDTEEIMLTMARSTLADPAVPGWMKSANCTW